MIRACLQCGHPVRDHAGAGTACAAATEGGPCACRRFQAPEKDGRELVYRGHTIRTGMLPGARPWAVWVDGELLVTLGGRQAPRRLAYSSEAAAMHAGKTHVKDLLPNICEHRNAVPGQTLGTMVCVDCDGVFKPRWKVSDCPEYVRAAADGEPVVPTLNFLPDGYEALTPHGKYAIMVTRAGHPIGGTQNLYQRTAFLPYFHPKNPATKEQRCQFLHRRDRPLGADDDPKTLEEAIQLCVEHARELEARPTAPEAEA